MLMLLQKCGLAVKCGLHWHKYSSRVLSYGSTLQCRCSTWFHSHNTSLCHSPSPSINPLTIGMTHLINLIFVCAGVCVSLCVCLFQSPPPVLYWSTLPPPLYASLLPSLCLRALSHSLLSIWSLQSNRRAPSRLSSGHRPPRPPPAPAPMGAAYRVSTPPLSWLWANQEIRPSSRMCQQHKWHSIFEDKVDP